MSDFLTYNGCSIDTTNQNMDPLGNFYRNAAPGLRPDTSNFMCYSGDECRTHFSRQQIQLMRCTISHWPENATVTVIEPLKS